MSGPGETVALISDIQGNLVALDAVLDDLQRRHRLPPKGRLVCLGDVASGPRPREVLAALQQAAALTVAGNMDALLLAPPSPSGLAGEQRRYAEMDVWAHERLGSDGRAYLAGFAPALMLELAGVRLFCVHGSPASFDDAPGADTPSAELEQMFRGVAAELLVTGNRHRPLLRTLGERTLLAPGSVGLPPAGAEGRPLRADYLLLHAAEGRLDIAFHTVDYDAAAFRRSVLESGMPHAAWFASQWQCAMTGEG